MPLDLTSDELWYGGFYELALEMGERDDTRLDAAIQACWRSSSLRGGWVSSQLDPAAELVQPTLATQSENGHLYGMAQVPGFGSTVCGSVTIREDSSQIDWLDFYFPIGGLSAVDARADSLWHWDSDVPYSWRRALDDYLVDIAERIAAAVPFRLGLIGFEVSGTLYRADLAEPIEPRRHITMLIPAANGGLRRIATSDDPPAAPEIKKPRRSGAS